MIARLAAVVLTLTASVAVAHPVADTTGPPAGASAAREGLDAADLWLSAGPMAVATILYALGLLRLLGRGAARPPLIRHALAFSVGLLMLGVALFSKLDALGGELFVAHMVQHELLMLLAAPLLVLGRPLPVFLWAFPSRTRLVIARVVRHRTFSRCWEAVSRPLAAWTLHAAALWLWHAPGLFDLALANRGVHDLQHLSFLVTALLFWTALLHPRQAGSAVLYLFTTAVHSSALGALLTFASHPLYSSYVSAATTWGLTPLEDQQLGGLIMWVPGSFVYVVLALSLLARSLSEPREAPTIATSMSLNES